MSTGNRDRNREMPTGGGGTGRKRGWLENMRAAAHVLLFMMLPEGAVPGSIVDNAPHGSDSPDRAFGVGEDDVDMTGVIGEVEEDSRRGDIAAWFTFWGLFVGIFSLGLLAAIICILDFSDLGSMMLLALSFVPVCTVGFFSATSGCWFGHPSAKSHVAAALTGHPSIQGIIVVVVCLSICLLVDFTLLPPPRALIFFLIALVVSSALPLLIAKIRHGTTGLRLAISTVISLLVQFVVLTVMAL